MKTCLLSLLLLPTEKLRPMCSKPQKLGTYCLEGKSDEPCSKVAHALASAIVSCTSAQDSRIKIYIPELEYLNLTLASGASPCETGYQHTRRPNHADACEKILDPYADRTIEDEASCSGGCELAYVAGAIAFLCMIAMLVGLLKNYAVDDALNPIGGGKQGKVAKNLYMNPMRGDGGLATKQVSEGNDLEANIAGGAQNLTAQPAKDIADVGLDSAFTNGRVNPYDQGSLVQQTQGKGNIDAKLHQETQVALHLKEVANGLFAKALQIDIFDVEVIIQGSKKGSLEAAKDRAEMREQVQESEKQRNDLLRQSKRKYEEALRHLTKGPQHAQQTIDAWAACQLNLANVCLELKEYEDAVRVTAAVAEEPRAMDKSHTRWKAYNFR